jgi:hypothetical protein
MTTNLNSWASCRLYIDVADITGKPAYGLYAMLKPTPSLALTFGQFKLPLGIEVLTKPENSELIQYSLIGRDPMRTPKGTIDIGMQLAYKHPFMELALACVNGNGRNMPQDDNKNKCVAGKFIVKPFTKQKFSAGVNVYTGKYGRPDTSFLRLGAELNLTFNPIIFKTEFLNTKYQRWHFKREWLLCSS